MTEQEIIEYLKENKNKGIANMFFPEEVRDWVSEHFAEPKLLRFNPSGILYLNPLGNWEEFDVCSVDDYDNIVFALSDDYEVKRESKGEWVEFDIDQKGNFHCFMDGDIHYFFWANWNVFLFEADSSGYTAFGGWLYDKSGGGDWVLSPQVGLIDDSGNAPFILNRYSHTYEKERITPAIPFKIRFWRES